MKNLFLVRHGQSIWNLEKKFTGWVDVDLNENGRSEAEKAGALIKMKQIKIDLFYSSYQLRAKNTLKLIQKILGERKNTKFAWQLNERHYGALTGLNKDQMKKEIGEERVHQFRRSWDLRPEPLDKKNIHHPLNIDTYKDIPKNKIPDTESLKDTYERVIEFYLNEIEKKSKRDAFKQYIAYHEGWGNYKNYKNNKKVINLAKRVEKQANIYNKQLSDCKNSLSTNKYIFF